LTLERRGEAQSCELFIAGYSVPIEAETVLALDVRAPDRATLTVRAGTVTLVGKDRRSTRLRRGQTVKLVAGYEPDLRASLVGDAAAVERVRTASSAATLSSPLPRGLGRMTARVPGTERVVSGVRLVKHHVRTSIRDGYARTEIEEEFRNETDRVLEGRYVFALPEAASISRLALWVGDELVEAEIVERKRAARVFKGIVDDSVRPRDPALLEWVSAGEFSLKIFPILPDESRRVLLAYNEELPIEGNVVRYAYPLSPGRDRATEVDDFSLTVHASDVRGGLTDVRTPLYPADIRQGPDGAHVSYSATQFTPARDFALTYGIEPSDQAELSVFVPEWGAHAGQELVERSQGATEASYFALRLTAKLPDGMEPPPFRPLNRVIVIDRGFTQGKEPLAAQVKLARALIADLEADERFALLACDSACDGHPRTGVAKASEAALKAASDWLAEWDPAGASDFAGALVAAARRLERHGPGQVVYLGDGRASAGELDQGSIAERVAPVFASQEIDLRLVGVGYTVDEVLLSGLASGLGATYDRLATGGALAARIDALTLDLRAPVLTRPRLELPESFTDVLPAQLPNLALGRTVTVVGKLSERQPGEVTLLGQLAAEPYRLVQKTTWPEQRERQNPLVPRLWAERRIAALSFAGDADGDRQIIELSRHHHVMSRSTSLLVLENERMFAEFGIERTQRRIGAEPAEGLLPRPGPPPPTELWGDGIGDSFGAGGLGMSGMTKPGNEAEFPRASGADQGFGAGFGRLGGSHRTRAPRLRMGAATVSGRLPPEVIQRIVRQNYGRFRLCYEQGLAKNPALEGRISIRFVIRQEGNVGSASDAGSSLPDRGVVQCVLGALYGLSFPKPEGDSVTVVYPISFSPGSSLQSEETPALRPGPTARPRTIAHRAGNEQWRRVAEKYLAELRTKLEQNRDSRGARAELLRGLFRHGRFEQALRASEEFARVDPDNAEAREWLARAAAINGAPGRAVTELASAIDLGAADRHAHRRVARAYEALGDGARACAHWRSAHELDSKDTFSRHQAIRCRAHLLAAGRTERYDPEADRPGWLEATVTCSTPNQRCPTPVVVTPAGSVVSPFTPERARAGADRVALTRKSRGVYRTLLVGGDSGSKGQLSVVADGVGYKREFDGGQLSTSIETEISGF
jgi:Ca-activated chloride channel family protein